MTVGERIKQRRKQLGINAEQVAADLGVSPSTVYRYENGAIEKMGIDKLEPLADALHTTPEYLMGWTDDPINYKGAQTLDIARKLYLLRTENGLTQAQLAEIAGVSDKAVSAWENGTREPKIGPMQKVCDHFGIDVHVFIDTANDIYKPFPDDRGIIAEYPLPYSVFEKLMTEAGETPYQVAKATGVAQSTLSDWKTGKSSPWNPTLKKLADHFGVSVSYLKGESDNQSIKKEPATPTGDELTDAIILGRDGKAIRRTYTKEQMEALRKIIDVMPYLDDEEL